MKVKVAETAGFCFGVKRAVDKVYELIDTEQKPIFTLGPIIHNEGVGSGSWKPVASTLSRKQTWIPRMTPCRTEQ